MIKITFTSNIHHCSPRDINLNLKKKIMKKQIGIWLDFREAHLITLAGEENKVKIISSEIEDFNIKGGARSKTPYGPMDVTSEKKYLERNKNQVDRYYSKIMEYVKDAEEIFIMGPAEAKIGLRKKMVNTNTFHPFIKGFETADSISENQKVARVREFFQNEAK